MTADTEPSESYSAGLEILGPGGGECGEVCDKPAVIAIDGMVFCSDCLGRLMWLGRAFVEAAELADHHLRAMVSR